MSERKEQTLFSCLHSAGCAAPRAASPSSSGPRGGQALAHTEGGIGRAMQVAAGVCACVCLRMVCVRCVFAVCARVRMSGYFIRASVQEVR